VFLVYTAGSREGGATWLNKGDAFGDKTGTREITALCREMTALGREMTLCAQNPSFQINPLVMTQLVKHEPPHGTYFSSGDHDLLKIHLEIVFVGRKGSCNEVDNVLPNVS
jgi:hypothetical protein